jgi:hypothetical protein
LNPKHEAANFKAEARRKGGDGRGKVDESIEPCECEKEISETKRKGTTGFTGEIIDSLNRRRCYQDGKEIHCGKENASSAQPGTDTDAIAATATMPEMEPKQPDDPPKRLDPGSSNPEERARYYSVTKWTNDPKYAFREDELKCGGPHSLDHEPLEVR